MAIAVNESVTPKGVEHILRHGEERTFEGQDRGKVNLKDGFGMRMPHAKESSITEGIAVSYGQFHAQEKPVD